MTRAARSCFDITSIPPRPKAIAPFVIRDIRRPRVCARKSSRPHARSRALTTIGGASITAGAAVIH